MKRDPDLRTRRAIFLALLVPLTAFANTCPARDSIADYLAKPSLNVVITVSDMAAAKAFYGEVLGIEPLPPIRFSDKTAGVFFPQAVTMERFRVGSHEIKLIPGLSTTKKQLGGVTRGIGLRMVNYPIPDIEAFRKRLAAHDRAMPQIGSLPGSSYRFGMLEDPDGNQVEFFYYDGDGPEGWQQSLQIALTVSDVEASRRFYGQVLGIQELPPIAMPGAPERQIYRFQLGPTLIKFWSFGKDLPNHAGRHLAAFGNRYIQYQTKDVDAAYEFVKSRGAKVDLPPTPVESMPVSIMFVADPDGIINEMFSVKFPGR
jgi:catechol 2,3-dioxygenase-like lactoylglutathione lyase family enzyme